MKNKYCPILVTVHQNSGPKTNLLRRANLQTYLTLPTKNKINIFYQLSNLCQSGTLIHQFSPLQPSFSLGIPIISTIKLRNSSIHPVYGSVEERVCPNSLIFVQSFFTFFIHESAFHLNRCINKCAMKVITLIFVFCFVFSKCNADDVGRNDMEGEGVWWPLLEEWTLTKNYRQERVMMIPISPNSYVLEDRNDNHTRGSKVVPGKIVATGSNMANKKPPGRQVSETDLYLLGAIEKLVYKVDFMEKRLRRVEEMLYYTMAGNRIDTDPCKENFTRVGSDCYHFHNSPGREYDWKVASKHCKKLGGFLAEMETIEENQDLITYIQGSQNLRGKDFWVGGLNPGLLWIWSNSARPVAAPGSQNNKENPSAAIYGEGRCLRVAYNPALRTYAYRGTDCSMRYSFVCEAPQTTSSNEIKRLGRERRILDDEL